LSLKTPIRGVAITPFDIWSYPTRTLTNDAQRLADIIKAKDYDRVTIRDLMYAPLAFMLGLITISDLASFVDYGVANRGLADVYASIIDSNPLNLWSVDLLVDLIGDANLAPSSIKSILASPEISGDRVQEILHGVIDRAVHPGMRDLLDRIVQLMTLDAPDASITSSTSLTSGVNRYRNLSIGSGVTLTLATGPGVIIADTISNSGTILSGWVRGSGGPSVDGSGAGGPGRGGIIIVARSVTVGTIRADGGNGGNGGTTGAYRDGQSGMPGLFWVVDPDRPPVGGRGGGRDVKTQPTGWGLGGANGGGGGGYFRIGGFGGTSRVVAFARPELLVSELFKAVVDWWIVSVLGKRPSLVRAIPRLGGGGGGSGSVYDGFEANGGGGGGGGQIIIYGTSVVAGTIAAKGGAGGAGGGEGSYDCGGGGGGGGVVYVFYRTLSGTFNFDVAGGSGGGGDYAGASGGGGVARVIAL
jgi:hypothetical protein